MSEGTILLSSDGYYAGVDSQLPTRPDFDKEFLLALCKGKRLLASVNTAIALPLSIINNAKYLTHNPEHAWDVNLGIATFGKVEDLPDIMFIVKSDYPLYDGRKFKTSLFKQHYKVIYDTANLSILIKVLPNG